ncbi:pyridoxal phosphate-dependent aminotransferase [Pseudorhodobacter sp. E13]|uniref:pyridoxal phosphate-dependent aminotransferase n=1 Tax=Pseudorhodobacter sp. E13 TaxID=2487931 RepID=UPI000F8D9180|nr:pyridoxal phosphate-dependent aminotransferase [Pseudorhodobacter sp. E13]RUS60011.1 pyridoxal phosphate-dependent aminotransferase [Pseudorhodobacter sp. E13]
MRYAAVTERLAGLGGAKWAVHTRARAMKAAGTEVIELTIGEPDVPTPPELMALAAQSMQAGRTGYSNGQGEPGLLRALAARYSTRRGRVISPDQIMCFPGTQTTLYAVLMGLLNPGDEVLVGDPMYATYEGLIAATGAVMVPVPLLANAGFRIRAEDIADRITPKTRVLFLNSPHNPTGAVLTRDDFAAIGALAKQHDLWILCDEVYEDLVFDGVAFASPLDLPDLADRVIVASSISKSHAAPGFRSGWCVGPAAFMERLLPLSETMLFGNQPFIADMTAQAIADGSPVAAGMVTRFARRADLVRARLDGVAGLRVHRPDAGMFALVDVGAVAADGERFAMALLEREGVAVMPGASFGVALRSWLRLSLTQPDAVIEEACRRIADFAKGYRA